MTQSPLPPLRLRRREVLTWRSPTTLQVGLQDPMVALEGVPPQVATLVDLLAEPRTQAELAARLPELDPSWIEWVCANLGSAGLLATPEVTPSPEVLLCGLGGLARELAAALTRSGVTVRRAHSGPGDTHDPQRLVVLAEAQVEPDRALTAQLAAAQVPHLVVRVEPSRAVVGPLVVPGRTACVRCLDLVACQFDPKWPLTLAQLCRVSPATEPGLAAWAVATAVTQVRAWLSGIEPETLGRTIELGSADFRLHSRAWTPHPDCGCVETPRAGARRKT